MIMSKKNVFLYDEMIKCKFFKYDANEFVIRSS